MIISLSNPLTRNSFSKFIKQIFLLIKYFLSYHPPSPALHIMYTHYAIWLSWFEVIYTYRILFNAHVYLYLNAGNNKGGYNTWPLI